MIDVRTVRRNEGQVHRRVWTVASVVTLVTGAIFVAVGVPPAGAETLVSYTQPGVHTLVVPEGGVACLEFVVTGAAGGLGTGSANPGLRSLGGRVFWYAGVLPGMTFQINVGGAGGDASGGTGGSGGVNGGADGGTAVHPGDSGGGGGGGASDVRLGGTTLADRVVVAGGGGGNGSYGDPDPAAGGAGGNGGDAALHGANGDGSDGGGGGSTTAGGVGGISQPPGTAANSGADGTLAQGGAGGAGPDPDPGSPVDGGGGGGGGGWFGGGGGGGVVSGTAGGGGGGSNLVPTGRGAGNTAQDANNGGNGSVVVNSLPADVCLGSSLTVTDTVAPQVALAPGTSFTAVVHCAGPGIDLSQFGSFGLTDTVSFEFVVDADGNLQPAAGRVVRIWMLTDCTVTQTEGPPVEPVLYSCVVTSGDRSLCHAPGPQPEPMTVSNVFVNQAVTISITNGFVSSPPPLDNLPVAILAQPRFTG